MKNKIKKQPVKIKDKKKTKGEWGRLTVEQKLDLLAEKLGVVKS